ncbi:MAG: hypothetical protein R3B93_11685 [Bacteroidia bacterium]
MKSFNLLSSRLGIVCLLLAMFWGTATPSQAQILDSENKLTVALSDGTTVTLFGTATSLSDRKTNEYYYLPVNPRLSSRPDGTPEFLFMKFTTEASEAQGGIKGALMHFLMEWGLTPAQEDELRNILKNDFNGAVLKGAANVDANGDDSFRIISGTLSDQKMAPTMVKSDKATVVPGSKVAVASRLDKNGAQLLAASFEKNRSVTDVSIELDFAYTLRYPAAQGRAVIDWSRVHTVMDTIQGNYSRTHKGFWDMFRPDNESYTYDEMRKFYEKFEEKKIVEVQFDANQDDERVDKVREAFFEYFINQMTEQGANQDLNPPTAKEADVNPDIKRGKSYTFNFSKFKQTERTGRQEFNLNYRLAIKRTFTITGNLGSWYDGVRDNPRCVSSVNLNDPFFQHRDINLILDLDAQDMFDTEVNYVTVSVRKRRTDGHDFSDNVTFDKEFIKNNGVKATLTYARGEDRRPDLFEYKMQWSLRGGKVFPENPAWTQGNWEGVTMAPPIKPMLMEVEADLDEMKAAGVTRITAQILYSKFNKLETTNIHISPAKGQPLVEQKLFADRYASGYAYRYIINTKEHGKLVSDWSEKQNDGYLFVAIDPELLEKDTPKFKKAQKKGLNIISETIDELAAQPEIKGMDVFKTFFDKLTNQ